MVVHVAAFLDLTDQGTAAMPAPDQVVESEVVLDLAGLACAAVSQDPLHPIPLSLVMIGVYTPL